MTKLANFGIQEHNGLYYVVSTAADGEKHDMNIKGCASLEDARDYMAECYEQAGYRIDVDAYGRAYAIHDETGHTAAID